MLHVVHFFNLNALEENMLLVVLVFLNGYTVFYMYILFGVLFDHE